MSNLEEFALMVSELIHTGEVKRKKWFLWEVIKKIPNVGFLIVTSQAPVPKMSRKLVTFLFTYSKICLAPCLKVFNIKKFPFKRVFIPNK